MGKSKCRLLREILKREDTILVPGCYDALSGKILKQAGFPLIYMSGSAVTASLLGKSDVGLLTMSEMVSQARNIVNATNLPLICDADTGYGNPINVMRTVQEFERVGVAGIHLEDQVMPKRCGHFEGKAIVTTEEMIGKIKAAISAREDKDFLIIARTDARSVLGLEEAMRRAHVYFETGADMLFIEAPESKEELETIASEFKGVPLMVNMVEGGKTPIVDFSYLKERGFKIVLYPTTSIRIVMEALRAFALYLKEEKGTKGLESEMVSFEMRNQILELNEVEEMERKFMQG